MKIIYFDLCAIPVYLLILWTIYSRKMTGGRSNRIFILLNIISLICTVVDVAMEFVVNPPPLSQVEVVVGMILSTTYKLLRNTSLVLYLLYIFVLTRTEYRLRKTNMRLLLWGPIVFLVVMLVQNLFTHNLFVVTVQEGYSRGPALIVMYVVAGLYGIIGCVYCVYCKRYLPIGKWVALFSVYVLTLTGVFVQLLRPEYLVEMFSTSIGILMVMLLVMRPEESLDGPLATLNYLTFQTDLRNTLISDERVDVVVVQMINAQEIRSYLGEDRYNAYMREVIGEIRQICIRRKAQFEVYFERPGTIYLLLDSVHSDLSLAVSEFLESTGKRIRAYSEAGVQFAPRICLIRCPEDLSELHDVLNLAQKFVQISGYDQVFCRAADLVEMRDYEIITHMDDILHRAVSEGTLEVFYQPIFDVKHGKFRSGEALARIRDTEYGMISPGLFIPAAEANGLILRIGELVMELVFRFISSHDMEALGLERIEINLSVSQMLQKDLPEKVGRLARRCGVRPDQVNFEITETLFDQFGDMMEQNVRALTDMGYTFSLDDYGVGFSNIQRMSRLPVQIVKIDKTLVDDMFSENGRVILKNTVTMMQGINKELIIEGVETPEARDALEKLSCDYIQGYYYSRPLPEEEFVKFLQEQNVNGDGQ